MDEAKQNRREIQTIKLALAVGDITYNEAKTKVEPILQKINKKGEEIAKKYGKKYYPITFVEVMR